VSTGAQRSSRLNSRVTLKAVALLSGVLTIVFLISFLFSKEGISELQQARQRVATLQQEIDRLRLENQQLAERINDLRNSTFSVEKIAREDLGMAKPGEIVYVVEEKRTPSDER
jgi:cell division protein FtsB